MPGAGEAQITDFSRAQLPSRRSCHEAPGVVGPQGSSRPREQQGGNRYQQCCEAHHRTRKSDGAANRGDNPQAGARAPARQPCVRKPNRSEK